MPAWGLYLADMFLLYYSTLNAIYYISATRWQNYYCLGIEACLSCAWLPYIYISHSNILNQAFVHIWNMNYFMFKRIKLNVIVRIFCQRCITGLQTCYSSLSSPKAVGLALASTPWPTPPVKKTHTSTSFWTSSNDMLCSLVATLSHYFSGNC